MTEKHNPGEPEFGDGHGGKHNPGEPEFGGAHDHDHAPDEDQGAAGDADEAAANAEGHS